MRIVELKIDEIDDISGFDAVALVGQPAHEADFFAFNNADVEDAIAFQVIKTAFLEQFVDRLPGESQDSYLGRCIPKLIDEGYDQDQATAICYETMALESQVEEEKFESYSDYPKAASENAKIALRYAEENGWGDCGTPVGKARANQLAKGEPISEETISRMASFARHRENGQRELGDGCGRLMWLAWGGDEGVDWAIRKLDQIEKERLSQEFSHFEDLPNDTQDKLLERLGEVGLTWDTLHSQGYEEVTEEEYRKHQDFALPTRSDANPDKPTNDTRGGYKVLFKYQVRPGEGPSIKYNSRDFCIRLIDLNLMFRKEDIDRLTIKGANSEEFGYYDIFKYKGSFNCRHEWKPVYVKQKEQTIADSPNLNIQNILRNIGIGADSIEDKTKPSNLRGDNPIVAFSKENFSFEEDKKIVVGPLMIPNKLIFRVDENNEPYYVYFSSDTIKQIATKMMRNKLLDRVNMEHDPNTPVKGYMVESWLVEDPEHDKQTVYGFNYPSGTWMGAYKIEDNKDWMKVKNGEVKGFSIEGFFEDRQVQS